MVVFPAAAVIAATPARLHSGSVPSQRPLGTFRPQTPQFTVPLIQGLPSVHDKLTPIAVYIQNDIVLLANPNSPWKGFKDFVDAAKQRERSVKFAGAQMGSTDSIIAGAIEKATGTKLNYIPFDGGGAAMAAFLGGNADLVALTLDEAMPLVKSGKGKILGLLAENRRTEPELKDIPTATEQGYKALYVQEFGTNGPPNMDPAIVAWFEGQAVGRDARRAGESARGVAGRGEAQLGGRGAVEQPGGETAVIND